MSEIRVDKLKNEAGSGAVEPAPTCITFSLINAIFPDAVSDSTVTDTPVPTVNVLGVLNILFKILVVSAESAVANPLTPVSSLPSPTNFVAVITPVTLTLLAPLTVTPPVIVTGKQQVS